MARRRGMIIKNVSERPMEIVLTSRTLRLGPGEERPITAREVKDASLRELLQVRSIAVVRPTTEQEESEFLALPEDDEG